MELNSDQSKAVSAFNLMRGEVNFNQINDIAEYLQIEDAELFVDVLITLKDNNNGNSNNKN